MLAEIKILCNRYFTLEESFMSLYKFILALTIAQPVYAAKTEESCLSPLSQTTAFYRLVPGNPKTTEIMAKMQAAIQKDPQWFQEHAKKAGPGQPLPYDKKLGISEEEYQTFLKGAKEGNALKLAKYADGKLEIKKSGDGFDIVAKAGPSDFKAHLDSKQGMKVEGFDKVAPTAKGFNNDKSPMGPIQGKEWKSEEVIDSKPGSLTGSIASVTVGVMKAEDRCFLNVDLKKVKQGVPTLREEFTVKW